MDIRKKLIDKFRSEELQDFTKYSYEHLKMIIKNLAEIVYDSELDGSVSADLCKKYNSDEFDHASKLSGSAKTKLFKFIGK